MLDRLASLEQEFLAVEGRLADPSVLADQARYRVESKRYSELTPVIAAYRPLAGKVVEGYWKELPADADHPTFALTPG